MERDVLKLALEELENMCDAQSNPDRRNFPTIHDYGKALRACIAIKAALAQQAQEQREWVGLTEEEIHNLDPLPHLISDQHRIDFARAVEAASKEKNNE